MHEKQQRKKIFIIGAGPSGIVALKEALEAGCFDPICVDAKSQIGGVFSVAYDKLYTTTSNMFLAFSDFPPKESIRYWTKEEYCQYLNDYIDHFNLRKYIKLNTAVKECILDKDTDRWKIITKSWLSRRGEMKRGSITFSQDDMSDVFAADNKRASFQFRQNVSPGYTYDADYLIVASGTNQVPNVPEFPNLSPDVELVHSADFTNASDICRDKRVLIIGNGESAADMAAQSSDVAKHVTLYSRRHFSLGFRFVYNFLKDKMYDERELLSRQEGCIPNDMLESIANNRILSKLPIGFMSILLDLMLSDVTSWHGEESTAGITARIMKMNFSQDFFALDTSPPTKSGGVLTHAAATKGLDILVSPKMHINGSTAMFENAYYFRKKDEQFEKIDIDVDLIILCTGYGLDFDWIGVEGEVHSIEPNPRKWFKHCFPPGLGHKVAFLGYARPNQGGIPQCSELLARYVTLLLKGEKTLPPNYAEIALVEGEEERATFYKVPNHHALVDFPSYTHSIARLIGCEPRAPFSPSRYIKFWTLPNWMYFYRLNGPGAKPQVCWDIIDQYRIVDTLIPFPLIIFYTLFGLLMQPFFLMEYILQKSLKEPSSANVLLKGYKARVGGHFYQLNGNNLRLQDVIMPSSGWLVVEIAAVITLNFAFSHILWTSFLLLSAFIFVKRDDIDMKIREHANKSSLGVQEKLNQINESSATNYGSTNGSFVV